MELYYNTDMYYVYILTNASHTVLYTGVTSRLIHRTYVHKAGILEGFTHQYFVNQLVYYEQHSDILQAIKREKQIKRWQRSWKERLISNFNPHWNDLSETLGIEIK